MTVNIRRPAVLFTLLSAIYWASVAGLWSAVTPRYFAYWIVVVSGTLPPIIYVLASFWFFRWLARYILRQVTIAEDGSSKDVQ